MKVKAELNEAITVLIVLFTLVIYMVAAVPMIESVASHMKPPDQYSFTYNLILSFSLKWAPIITGIGFIVWLFAAIARKEGYHGAR